MLGSFISGPKQVFLKTTLSPLPEGPSLEHVVCGSVDGRLVGDQANLRITTWRDLRAEEEEFLALLARLLRF